MEKIYYGKAVYNNKEINAVIKVLKKNSLNLIDGPSVKLLEKKVARIFGKKFGLMVNSGSSANLLALSSLNIGFTFGKNTDLQSTSLAENYFAMNLGIILSPPFFDRWFRKRKLD